MRRLFLSLGLAALTCSLAFISPASAQDALARAKAAGVLQVATEMQYPPYDFLKGGEHMGVNVDLFDEIGKEMGLKIEYTDLPWASVLPGLEAKKYDVVTGPTTITAERMKRFSFSIPMNVTATAIMKRKGDDSIMKSADIAGKPIGSQRASYQLDQLKAYAETLPEPPVIKEYVDNNQAYADLAAGRIDGVANSAPNLLYAATQRPDVFEVVMPSFGTPSYSGYLVRKDDDSKTLIDAINAAMLKIQKDGRMKAIQEKWFGYAVDLPSEVPAP